MNAEAPPRLLAADAHGEIMHGFHRTLGAALLVILALVGSAAAKPPAAGPTPPLPVATPESQGMSSERLARGGAEIQRFLDEGRHAGAISLVVRDGKIVDWAAHGKRDLEAGLPMEKDTIVRIYSMSKIVTSVAALILLEEARFRLDDPIGEYLPELAHMKVLTAGTAEKPLLADANRPITIKHLFTHTSGLTYDFGESPVEKLNRQAKLPEAPSLADFVVRVSRLPLAHEPGERFSYGVSTDILGALVEKVSGRSFGAFLEDRVLRPLGMKDTGFSVPDAKLSRLAKIYEKDKDGKLQPAKPLFGIQPSPGPKLESGGAGLFSTAGDYARFMQMLLNGGQLEGVRILSRKTVELMMANHLNSMGRTTHQFSESDGFGLGGSVRLDLAKSNTLGSVGQFGWDGAATTLARLDPKERLVMILLVQHFPFDEHKLFGRYTTLVYAAIVD
jgi:CubicO group peptidase (beta-lactamase class C family)